MTYFKYNYKKILMPIIFFTFVGLCISTFPILLMSTYDINRANINLAGLGAFLLILTIFVPVYEFRTLKSKKGADLYYSLPITKRQLNFQIYIKGLIEIVIPFIIVFILSLLAYLVKGFTIYYVYFLPTFFVYLLGLIATYTLNVFSFSKGNNIIDGAIFIVFTLVLSLGIFYVIDLLFNFTFEYDILLFSPLYLLFGLQSNLTDLITLSEVRYFISVFQYLTYGFWFIISTGLGLLFIFNTKNDMPENIMQKSTSWYGYKLFIPLSIFVLSFILHYFDSYNIISIYNIIILAFGYIMYIIYEKSFKIGFTNLAILIGTVICSIIVILIINSTNGHYLLTFIKPLLI